MESYDDTSFDDTSDHDGTSSYDDTTDSSYDDTSSTDDSTTDDSSTTDDPAPTWEEGKLGEDDVIQDRFGQGYTSESDYVHGDDPIEQDPSGAYDDPDS